MKSKWSIASYIGLPNGCHPYLGTEVVSMRIFGIVYSSVYSRTNTPFIHPIVLENEIKKCIKLTQKNKA